MDISAYRSRLEAELADVDEPGGDAAADAPGEALAVAQDPGADPERRMAALRASATGTGATPGLVSTLLGLLVDTGQPIAMRREALVLLQQLSFRSAAIPGLRADLLGTLRGLVRETDTELRRRVLGVLARERDEYVQRLLLDGLERRGPALVPAAKAIQYLGYDVHAEYFPLLRSIVEQPPNRAAKKEAIRLLAADPGATDILVANLRDRGEPSDVRRLCAVSLQSNRPDVFADEARAIAVDGTEDEQLRALALSALAHLTGGRPAVDDDDLSGQVERLSGEARSPQLKRASTAYLQRGR